MKTVGIFLALLFFCINFLESQQPRHYGPVRENNWNVWKKLGSGTPQEVLANEHDVGWDGSAEYRTCSYWTWQYSDIPTEANVTSVTIKFRVFYFYNADFVFSLHNINSGYRAPSINFYNECNDNTKFDDGTLSVSAGGTTPYEKTFTSADNPPLIAAIQNVITSGSNFFTLGIKFSGSSMPPPTFWVVGENTPPDQPAIDLTINYTVPNDPSYQFVNKIEGSQNYGNLIIDNNKANPISSGSTPPPFSFGSTHTVRTNELPFIVNWNGTGKTEKHLRFYPTNSDYSLNHSFVANSTTPSLQDANFVETKPATITTLYDGGSGSPSVELRDPWFYYKDGNNDWFQTNQFVSYPTPFAIANNASNSYGGVFLNQSDFNGTYYSIRSPLVQDTYVPQTGRMHKFYFQNWSATGASLQQVGSNPTGYDQKAVVFNSANATINANLKGTHFSNTSTSFTNNSQRKLVKTKDGWLHQVYESAGRVWLEHSTDNGTTWFLGNNGQPLDNGAGKNPSIDWHYNTADPNNTNYYAVVVVFQQQSGSTYTIPYVVFKNTSGSYVRQGQNFPGPLYTEPSGGDQYSTTNANPNIAWGASYCFCVTFERKSTAGGMQPGIYWRFGYMDESGVEPANNFSALTKITGTDAGSTNATLHLNKAIYIPDSWLDVVYQQGTSSIKDAFLWCTYNGVGSWSPGQLGSPSVISSASGVLNYKPSMVQMPDNNIRVCWIRDWYGMGSITPYYVNAVYWSSTSPAVYNCSGNMVNSVSLNLKDATSNIYFAYAQKYNNATWQNLASNGSSTVSLSTTGQHIQLSNGPSSSAMNASSYYPSSLPYYFLNNSLGGLSKSSGEEFTYGRGIALNGLGFFYSLKSLTVDKSNIRFVEIPEKNDTTTRRRGMQYVTLDSLNTMLISEPFTVGEGTSFTFSDDGGFPDSSAVQEVLGKNGYISCKLELVDDATGKTLGVMKESKFSSSTSSRGNLSASRLNLKGTGTKNVRVKITIGSNVDSLNGVWVNEYGTVNDEMLGKLSMNELELQKSVVVTEYALEQNYPNPFNPSTTISYALPMDGMVTIKIYDALGREVRTLVNEFKTVGRYNVEFDASALASGLYIYRLVSHPAEGGTKDAFTAVKKMLLVK